MTLALPAPETDYCQANRTQAEEHQAARFGDNGVDRELEALLLDEGGGDVSRQGRQGVVEHDRDLVRKWDVDAVAEVPRRGDVQPLVVREGGATNVGTSTVGRDERRRTPAKTRTLSTALRGWNFIVARLSES